MSNAQDGMDSMKRKLATLTGVKGNWATGQQSDLLLIVAMFHGWLRLVQTGQVQKAKDYIREHQLHSPTLEIISKLISCSDGFGLCFRSG